MSEAGHEPCGRTERSLRIALVVHQYPPDHVGGTEIHTQTLARSLAGRGHAVAVFVPRVGLRVDRQSSEAGVSVWEAACPALSPMAHPLRQFWRTFRNHAVEASFRRFLGAFRPELVHFQHLQNVSVRLIRLARGLPRLLTLHDYWYVCANSQLLRPDGSLCKGPGLACAQCVLARLPRPLPRALEPAAALPLLARNAYIRQALRGIERFVAPSDYVRTRYAAWGLPADRITVLPHGVSPERLAGPQAALSADTPGSPRFGYLGALAPAKGVHILIEAFNSLPPEAGLMLYGDPRVFPGYVERLREHARHPGIRFAGPVPHERIGQALRHLDYLVVPSLWNETLCMVVDEAHAVGVPVIASRLGALTRIRDGVDGRLFQAGNVAELAAILQELCERPELRAYYAAHLEAVPTVAEQTAKLLVLYETLVAR